MIINVHVIQIGLVNDAIDVLLVIKLFSNFLVYLLLLPTPLRMNQNKVFKCVAVKLATLYNGYERDEGL